MHLHMRDVVEVRLQPVQLILVQIAEPELGGVQRERHRHLRGGLHKLGNAQVRGLLGDAKSSLGDAESSLCDAKSSLGDAKSFVGDSRCGTCARGGASTPSPATAARFRPRSSTTRATCACPAPSTARAASGTWAPGAASACARWAALYRAPHSECKSCESKRKGFRVGDFAHEAVSRRPPISVCRIIARSQE